MNINSDDWTGIGNPKKIVPPPEGWPPRDDIQNLYIFLAMLPFVGYALLPYFMFLLGKGQ